MTNRYLLQAERRDLQKLECQIRWSNEFTYNADLESAVTRSEGHGLLAAPTLKSGWMSRRVRTSRLLVAAILSCTAFVAVAIVGVRSLQFWDVWYLWAGRQIALTDGCVLFGHQTRGNLSAPPTFCYMRIDANTADLLSNQMPNKIYPFGFSFKATSGGMDVHYFAMPLWPLLLLLLIAPVRWRLALPADCPAFPVVTDTQHGNR